MAIPDFQSIMLPLLQFCGDTKEHTNREAIDHLADVFNLSEEEQKELLPSGRQAIFQNRVAWARAYMKMAKLLENTQRGVFRITDRGSGVLQSPPQKIDIRFLMQFLDFAERRKAEQNKLKKKNELSSTEPDTTITPEEQIEEAYENLRDNLTSEILSQLKDSSPSFFEKVVVEVLVKMGYGGSRKDAGEAIGKSGDEGIDGIIKEDRLGLDIIYIQAKKWENTVSRPEIQKFAGALQGKRAKKGIFITTSDFSRSCEEYVFAIDSKIILIDGQRLAQLMIDFNVGVSTEAVYELKRIDSDYFAE
ncbi:MAG: restriction endonuclease [Candidatus Babeliaceae bacterium]|nr:restriction endonuclease [Candidatus Babeliaceae bacterium]